MKNRKLAMGITAAAMAGFIGLVSVYGSSIGAQIRNGWNGSETETEETESETEISLDWVEALFDFGAKNTAMTADGAMMMEADGGAGAPELEYGRVFHRGRDRVQACEAISLLHLRDGC